MQIESAVTTVRLGFQLNPSGSTLATFRVVYLPDHRYLPVTPQDGTYQRARVVSLGRRDIKVQYIDVGTSELVPIQSALALEQRFAAMPPQVGGRGI